MRGNSLKGIALVSVDCSHVRDYELKLASYLLQRLDGRVLALVKGKRIVFDEVSDTVRLEVEEVAELVKSFFDRTSLSGDYELNIRDGKVEVLVLHDNYKNTKGKFGLPPNVYVCFHCGYTTPYESIYNIHTKIHYV